MLYPIGIQSFENVRRGGFAYVDKTRRVYEMAKTGKYFFLSRPRRFGKSLFVSTLEAYFSGRKELFDGLEIAGLEKAWTEFPVLHLDFTGGSYGDSGALEQSLDAFLSRYETMFGVNASAGSMFGIRFGNLLEKVFEKAGKQAVVLIDEYDKPILDNFGNAELRERNRNVLQGFYSVLKGKDAYIRFGFLTGVSKFGKISVFSGLNNVKDISLIPEYADVCGITEAELKACFDGSVGEMAEANGMTKEECYRKLKAMYDGYHFGYGTPGLYNPFSLLNALQDRCFNAYWFETGTPTMLADVAKRTEFDITTLSDNVIATASALGGMQDIVNNPVPLFFQTGYLTIKDYDKEYREYRLGFPNEEVKDGFLNFIYSYYVPVNPGASADTRISALSRALKTGRPEDFMKTLSALFANATYQIQGNAEKDFQYAMYIILELLGEHVDAEKCTSDGRIDLLVKTRNFIYVMELKVDKTPDEALAQIEEKGYARPFADDRRTLYKIGVNFSTAKRCIDSWKIV